MRLLAPAKINRYLRVFPPDSSGYHPIDTELQAVGLYDELTITQADEEVIECAGMELPLENTLTKALRLARELVPVPHLNILLQKRIPAQAGLGGGSSDAAALLRWVQSQWPISDKDLRAVAANVGMDVPFFLVGGRARASGYGDVLQPLPDGPREWFVIALPAARVVTAAAYRELDRVGASDFEAIAPAESLELKRRLLGLGAQEALLCGSGSAVFGRFAAEGLAELTAGKLDADGVWVVPSLTRQESLCRP